MMGHGTKLLLLLFAISFSLYLIGYSSPFLQLITGTSGETSSNVFDIISDTIKNNLLASISLGIIVVGGAALIGGSGLVTNVTMFYLIGFLISDLFLMPMSFLFDPSLPIELKMLLGGFLNILLIGVLMSFTRGTDF